VLPEQIKLAETTTDPITLVVKTADRVKVIKFDYHAGLHYPHLERVAGAPALLDSILAPRK
jgi:hypothetical protein